ncbi:MAG: nuclear transport factor 2 family protein [Candidatus Eisenbacteria bacterium]
MRRIPVVLLLLLAVLATPTRAATPPPLKGSAAAGAAWLVAMKANDLDAVVACYADDATLWMPGGPRIDGKAAIRTTFSEMLAANTIKDALISNARYETSGNLGTGWGQFTITIQPKTGGDLVVWRGHFTDVTVRRGAKWLYLVDHATEDAPAAVTTGDAARK